MYLIGSIHNVCTHPQAVWLFTKQGEFCLKPESNCSTDVIEGRWGTHTDCTSMVGKSDDRWIHKPHRG